MQTVDTRCWVCNRIIEPDDELEDTCNKCSGLENKEIPEEEVA